jgi:hypothetical protein
MIKIIGNTVQIGHEVIQPVFENGNYNYSNGLTIDELEQIVALLKKHFVTKDDLIGNEPVTRQIRLNPEERNENI